MYKFILLFVIVNLITNSQSLPSFRWRKSARSDSSSNTFLTTTTSNQQPQTKFIDLNFIQHLPKYVFSPLKRSQSEFISINSLDKSSKPFDSNYHSYETLSNQDQLISTNFKPILKNDLDDIYLTNEPYEDDDVIVIPFTKHRGQAKFGNSDNKPFKGKNEEGVPSAVGYDPKQKQVISKKSTGVKNHLSNFNSKVLKDGLTDDLDTSDDLPASLSDDETSDSVSSPDFKVQFSDLHPIYVKPPKEFQPIFYPNRQIDGLNSKVIDQEATIKPIVTDSKQERPYLYPNGVSSWILGGNRVMQRGGYWENYANDQSLYGYNTANKKVELELNDNNLDQADLLKRNGKSIELTKNPNELNLLNNDNLEIISLNEPKRSDETEFKKENKIKKINLIGKFKKSTSNSLNKAKLLKRKLNLRPKKSLTKANKLIDKSIKNLN